MSVRTVLSYPIPAYQNLPIEPQFYQPSRFVISNISIGSTTTVTTSVDHNYVVGQLVRLLIPAYYGSIQLNFRQGYVISIPSATQVVIDIDSRNANFYVVSPFIATITNITQASQAVVTTNNSFLIGAKVLIEDVSGMTQLNDNIYTILTATATSITLNVNSTGFSAYTSGGTATIYPVNNTVAQIIAIGDNNSGIISQTGQVLSSTNIPGSFINISPQ